MNGGRTTGAGGPPARAILVTGSHRSGTTWLGRLLSLSGETHVVHEPFNPTDPRTWFSVPTPRWFLHVTPAAASPWDEQLRQVLAIKPALGRMMLRRPTPRNAARVLQIGVRARMARRTSRPLLKDPIAFFSAEWIASTFDTDVVVLVRHPAAFASSLKRLNWTFDFRNLSEQDRLMDGLLRPFRTELVQATKTRLDIIDQAILLWRAINATALDYRARHSDWTVMRYEDLAANPERQLGRLYEQLHLRWSPHVARELVHYTGADNRAEVDEGDRGGLARDSSAAMWTWADRLDDGEIARVRSGTSDVADCWYSSEDWSPPQRTSGGGLRPG